MFQEGKVYADRFNRLYFCQNGFLHTSTGFKYNATREEEYTLTRLTKEQMMDLIEYKRNMGIRYR